MWITKVLNNSTAVVTEDGIEKIVLGRGIIFGKKVGDFISSDIVEKTFIIESENEKDRLINLIQEIPDHCINIVEEVVAYAESILKTKLNVSIHLTLSDHINFILKRYEKGIFPTNALKYEIKRYYAKEYQIAEKAVELLEDEYDIELNEDEVASIAMHIVNAEFNVPTQIGVQIIKIVDHIIQIIKYYLQVDIDVNSIHYQRLLTHLRFLCGE
ncbi:PRD domain-containing protein [Jeotgalibaca sp. MA1X17-3]|uniref:PRD domain-containing protein n=1 Tax=Jeotgalibaca sp. MA1X17-3 TaxID=2908211 RepID=UPI001F2284B4|nr:PRD domain-containing protein [Jeotgalibaca sp. MA1X17-3]UJF16634.1 PRD domain-containing protein [Jeotgalibaca sp. MA1X17-3]